MIPAELLHPGRPNLRVLESTGSTNQEALAWAAAGAPHLAAVAADAQSAGRGRLDRAWHSPPGRNIYLSVVLRGEEAALRRAPWVGALAARDCVARWLGEPVFIKWPNDILVRDRKVCGILAQGQDSPQPVAVLGLGINVNMAAGEFPSDLRQPATSLKIIAGRGFSRGPLLAELLDEVGEVFSLAAREPGVLMDRVRQHCRTLGQRVEVALAAEIVRGTAFGLDDDGALLVRDDSGRTHTVVCGDVAHVR